MGSPNPPPGGAGARAVNEADAVRKRPFSSQRRNESSTGSPGARARSSASQGLGTRASPLAANSGKRVSGRPETSEYGVSRPPEATVVASQVSTGPAGIPSSPPTSSAPRDDRIRDHQAPALEDESSGGAGAEPEPPVVERADRFEGGGGEVGIGGRRLPPRLPATQQERVGAGRVARPVERPPEIVEREEDGADRALAREEREVAGARARARDRATPRRSGGA